MATEAATFKDAQFVIVSLTPDVCLTPMGGGFVPIPYPTMHDMGTARQCSRSVFFNGKPAFLHNESYADQVKGDEPGVKGGVVTGVHMKVSHSILHSPSVFINEKPMVRTGDQMWMNQPPPGA